MKRSEARGLIVSHLRILQDPGPSAGSAQLSHVVRLLFCPTGDQGRRLARPSQGESRLGEARDRRC